MVDATVPLDAGGPARETDDVVTRELVESALEESEARYCCLVKAIPDGVVAYDPEGNATYVNDGFVRLYGWSREEIIGKPIDFVPADEKEKTLAAWRRTFSGESIWLETKRRTKAGELLDIQLRTATLRDREGRITGSVVIHREVTDRGDTPPPQQPAHDEPEQLRATGRPRSRLMESTLEQVRLAARSESIVLLLGESGSGKDHLAQYLHDHSRRAGGPFFAINCAALAASIAESELFGHEPGSFTGARGRKRGLLEMAEGGTLLLNEIGELSPDLQVKLLTFLDTQSFTRVGGERTVRVDARIVGATNRDLEQEVAAGRFRKDLYYRLNVFSVRVPPLRERKEEIPIVAREILASLSARAGRSGPPALHRSAAEALSRHDWPGNVRELRNVLERALALCRGDALTSADIDLPARAAAEQRGEDEIAVSVSVSRQRNLNEALDTAKRGIIVGALARSCGNVTAAARLLGISRDALRHHMKMLALSSDPAGEGGGGAPILSV